jgi:transcriptional regulator with XRE-family HTH domain
MLRLREYREKRQLSLRKLAELSDVHFVHIAKMEAGQLDPQLSTLLKLCKALNITLNELVKQSKQKGGHDGSKRQTAKG